MRGSPSAPRASSRRTLMILRGSAPAADAMVSCGSLPIAVRVTRGLFDDLFPRTSDLTRAAVSDATVPSAGGSRNGTNAEVCEANGATRERQEHALRGVRAKFERGPTSFEASHQPKLSSYAT